MISSLCEKNLSKFKMSLRNLFSICCYQMKYSCCYRMTEAENIIIAEEKNSITAVLMNEELGKNIEKLDNSCRDNAEFFARDNTENGQRLYLSFLGIIDNLQLLRPKIQNISSVMHEFDFDENVQGNGYRSFISVVGCAVNYSCEICLRVQKKRDSVLFWKTSITKDIECCAHLLASLDTCLKHLEMMISWSKNGSLFPDESHSAEELLAFAEEINQYSFYGRCSGFQFCESLRNVLRFVSLTMAIFSEAYYSKGSFFSKATNSVVTSTKYLADPELRAKRIVNISKNAGVDFCKAFWFLSESELMNQIPSVVSSKVAVSKIINLPAEPFKLSVDGREIEVPVPSSHIDKKSIQVRLISHMVHEGMVGESKNKADMKPASPFLLVHCHGGGFVAQSSKSHECYLRDWAKQLAVPILSIDYSLAPEAPFPRALEEVTYAYCWVLKNYHLLGSTGESIVVAGDSAGATLLLSASLKCISLDIPTPKGIFLAYVPTMIDFIPSPARMLCMMDPLLPFGFLLRCLKAYAIPDPNKMQAKHQPMILENSDSDSFEEITESDLQELQAHKSPISETSDTLTYGSLCSNLNEENRNFDFNTSDIEEGEKYVSDFLEKYVLDSDTETDATKIALEQVSKNENCISSSTPTAENSIHNRVSSFMTNLKERFNNIVIGNQTQVENTKELDDSLENQPKLIDEFSIPIPPNPFLSPMLASDELLKKLPPVKILTVELDPCLDDCVMFARKLKFLNKNVSLDILKGLPHGFLNLSVFSKEAYEGSKLCVERIKELFNFPNN